MAKSIVQTGTGGLVFIDEASSAVGCAVHALTWNVNRAPTNTALVGTLPANARILDIKVQVTVVSNSATSSTVSVGLGGGTATYFSAAADVKSALANLAQTPTVGWVPSASKQDVTCTYTEVGASTAGTSSVTITYCVL